MNSKLLFSIAVAVIVVGCNKKEETVAPPATQPATNVSTPAPAATPNANAVIKPGAEAAADVQQAPSSTATSGADYANAVMANGTNSAALDQVITNGRQAATSIVSQVETSANATNTEPISVAAQNALSGFNNGLKSLTSTTTAVPSNIGASTAAVTPASASGISALADLSTDQVTSALKEALGKGLQNAVASLGQPGGFLTNVEVKIPLPTKIQPVEKALRAIGQGALVDQCIDTMNQAAEQAVPVAADVFVNGLKNMSVDDAKGILNGPVDAATQYFRRTTEAELTQKFTPIVQQAMTKCGATAAYQQLLDKAKVASPFFSSPSLDLNAYVTGKAMDGLFKMVADEEKTIRQNPVARSTDLLKSVFGAVQK